LLPNGGVPRGSVVGVGGRGGATSLALSLAVAPSQQGSWTGAVGLPELGLVAAAELGIDLSRFAVVPEPGKQRATVAAALLDALDVVLLRPPGRVRLTDARRLTARARERGTVLVVNGDNDVWPETPPLRLVAASVAWQGLGEGYGHLRGRHMEVVVTGRGAASRERRGTAAFDLQRVERVG